MKLLFILLAFVISGSALAAPKKLKPCSLEEVSTIRDDISEKEKEGLPYASVLVSEQGKVVGYFVTDNDVSIYAEVCEYMDGKELTTTNHWYYWESENKANPSSWTVGTNHQLMQDEGLANIKVLGSSDIGKVLVEFSVQGWDEESEIKTVRQEKLLIVPVLKE